MISLSIAFCFAPCIYNISAVDSMSELKGNILNFGHGVNFKYQGLLTHSFDRFYVVTKYEIPKVTDLKLTTINYDFNGCHLSSRNIYQNSLLKYCEKIIPYVKFYNKQIEYYNHTAYEIL